MTRSPGGGYPCKGGGGGGGGGVGLCGAMPACLRACGAVMTRIFPFRRNTPLSVCVVNISSSCKTGLSTEGFVVGLVLVM